MSLLMNFLEGEFRRCGVRNSLCAEFDYFASKSCYEHTLEIFAGTDTPNFSTERCRAELKHIDRGNYLQIACTQNIHHFIFASCEDVLIIKSNCFDSELVQFVHCVSGVIVTRPNLQVSICSSDKCLISNEAKA